MGNRIDGKVCIITGSGSGMGRASAIEMAKQGGKIVVTALSAKGGEETLEQIKADGGEAIFIKCDLRNRQEIVALINGAVEAFGGIDVLHNNAAIHDIQLAEMSNIEVLAEEVWDEIFEVNLKAMWRATQFALPYLKRSKGASIINVGSAASLEAHPMASCYCITKAAVTMLTKVTAQDLAKYGIRCNCYCPGGVDTPMAQKYYESAPDPAAMIRQLASAQLMTRLADPVEVAKLACFLASDDASFITGAVYMIDGGMSAWRGNQADIQ